MPGDGQGAPATETERGTYRKGKFRGCFGLCSRSMRPPAFHHPHTRATISSPPARPRCLDHTGEEACFVRVPQRIDRGSDRRRGGARCRVATTPPSPVMVIRPDCSSRSNVSVERRAGHPTCCSTRSATDRWPRRVRSMMTRSMSATMFGWIPASPSAGPARAASGLVSGVAGGRDCCPLTSGEQPARRPSRHLENREEVEHLVDVGLAPSPTSWRFSSVVVCGTTAALAGRTESRLHALGGAHSRVSVYSRQR